MPKILRRTSQGNGAEPGDITRNCHPDGAIATTGITHYSVCAQVQEPSPCLRIIETEPGGITNNDSTYVGSDSIVNAAGFNRDMGWSTQLVKCWYCSLTYTLGNFRAGPSAIFTAERCVSVPYALLYFNAVYSTIFSSGVFKSVDFSFIVNNL